MRRILLGMALVAAALVAPMGVRADPGVPVVLIPGWHGDPASFDRLIPALRAAGIEVLDFDPARPGPQALSYAPTGDGQHIPDVAARVVAPAVEAALARAGRPRGAPVDVVGYSMGGLVARHLVERAGWADRVGTLVMLGTPNHGTIAAWVPAKVGGFGRWNTTGGDMRPGSPFLRGLGAAEPPGERYVTVGGAPPWLPFPRHDHDGDGVAHGYDGLVPAESPFVTGAEHYLVPAHHAALPGDPRAVGLVTTALGRRPAAEPPGGGAPLTGEATIRLEYAAVRGDHDRWTDDENRFAVSVDPDGGGDGFVPLGEVAYRRDGPFTQDWGDGGPTVGPVRLPGTSARVDVRLDLSESDPWGRQVVATAVFPDVMLSDDIDGMDYYEAAVPVPGGRHVFRISLNGVSAFRPR
ncbi:MAG TPA: alpha/beta fold hydrolase [Acidimicrobiia bacterium]|nr:alpha/beta fold hydrolase [Acidimicrobiia bacterium]